MENTTAGKVKFVVHTPTDLWIVLHNAFMVGTESVWGQYDDGSFGRYVIADGDVYGFQKYEDGERLPY